MSPSSRVEAAVERSELVHRALTTARELHAGTVRDVGDEIPFIDHPLAVAELLAEDEQGDERSSTPTSGSGRCASASG